MAKKASKIATSKSRRTGIALKTATTVGLKKAKAATGQLLRPDEERKKKEDQEIAETLFRGLCQLRGTALKFAQAICGESDLLPPHYMEVLERSQYRVPALNPVLAAKVIRTELGDEPGKVFAHFEREAFAAASLGQVHRAESRDGRPLAVKIQYPGIDGAIQSDLRLAKTLLAPIGGRGLAMSILDEVEERLREEVDYRLEAANARAFAEGARLEGVIVPAVHGELSGRTVICYDLIDGQHLPEWLETAPSRSARDRVGQKLFDFFTLGLFELGMIHSDPNLGNFLVLRDESVAVLDFGSVKRIEERAVKLFALLSNYSEKPAWRPSVLKLYSELGADLSNEDEFMARAVLPYALWLDGILARGAFDFAAEPRIAETGRRVLMKEAFAGHLRHFTAEFTMLHRTFLGLLRTFAKLECRIDFAKFRSASLAAPGLKTENR